LVADGGVAIELRQSRYLKTSSSRIIGTIKRIVRPMLGFKDINCARKLIAGIETMHMVKKGQLGGPQSQALSAPTSSTALPSAASASHRPSLATTPLIATEPIDQRSVCLD